MPRDPDSLRGEARYDAFVACCRELGVLTPEDPWPVWNGPGGAATVAPLFLLYDYTFRVNGVTTQADSLARAEQAGVVCADEYLLHYDPHPGRAAWCRTRVADAEKRLAACDPAVPLVLVNHWPLTRTPTDILAFPEFAQWCGTVLTADWHRRFNVEAVVYGHLHIPRSTVEDGVRFEEVSLGYPREWMRRGRAPRLPRTILPAKPP